MNRKASYGGYQLYTSSFINDKSKTMQLKPITYSNTYDKYELFNTYAQHMYPLQIFHSQLLRRIPTYFYKLQIK